MIHYATFESPFGTMGIAASGAGVVRLLFPEEAPFEETLEKRFLESRIIKKESPVLKAAIHELHAYFKGNLTKFSIPIDLEAPVFYKKTLQEVSRIPYGSTASYGEIAKRVGNPKAMRAVGSANANNPVPIIIPCHRVISHNGDLGGYGGDLSKKAYLLELEGYL